MGVAELVTERYLAALVAIDQITSARIPGRKPLPPRLSSPVPSRRVKKLWETRPRLKRDYPGPTPSVRVPNRLPGRQGDTRGSHRVESREGSGRSRQGASWIPSCPDDSRTLGPACVLWVAPMALLSTVFQRRNLAFGRACCSRNLRIIRRRLESIWPS